MSIFDAKTYRVVFEFTSFVSIKTLARFKTISCLHLNEDAIPGVLYGNKGYSSDWRPHPGKDWLTIRQDHHLRTG